MSATETLAGLTAAPDSVTVAGRKITLHPLTMADIGLWNRWARAEFLTPALEACTGLAAEARLEAQKVALTEARKICFGFDEPGVSVLTSNEGMLEAIRLSLAHGKDAPAAEAVAVLFRNENNVLSGGALAEALEVILCLSGFWSVKKLLEVRGALAVPQAPEAEKKTETKAS